MENLIPEEFYYIESPFHLDRNFRYYPIKHNLIGYIDLEDDIGLCRVEVNRMEGMTPHFHITDHKDFDIAICIYDPYWYTHVCYVGEGIPNSFVKDSNIQKLRDILNNWLAKPSDQNANLSNWELICKIWWKVYDREGMTTDFNYFSCISQMPDYANLKRYPNLNPSKDTWYGDLNIFGTINLSEDIGECDVLCFDERGTIPHFHIVSKDRVSFNLCLCVFSNEYFFHEKEVEITDEQKKVIDEWLQDKWDIIRANWYFLNDDKSIDKKIINLRNIKVKPDYTTITKFAKKVIVYAR